MSRGPHKSGKSVREIFREVFEILQSENNKYMTGSDLETWAMRNPSEFYKLASKLIPAAIEGNVGMTLNVVTGVPAAVSDEDVEEFA